MDLKTIIARLEAIERMPTTPAEQMTTLRQKVRELKRDIEDYVLRTTGTL